MKRPYARYLTLALMFFPIAAYHARQASDLFRRASGSLLSAAIPFGLTGGGAALGNVSGGEIISWMRPEAVVAGLRAGDRPLQRSEERRVGKEWRSGWAP